MVRAKVTPRFTLAAIDELEPELKPDGKIFKTLYVAISTLTEELMIRAGVPITPPYEDFLNRRLRGALIKYKRDVKKVAALDSDDKKELWKLEQVRIALDHCHAGHTHIDRAWRALLLNEREKFVFEVCAASVWFGRMRAIYDLYQDDIFPRLGALATAINGAKSGGLKSGVTRRQQSKLPSRNALLDEREKLIQMGKSSRYVCAMLAKKYSCTTDHVRKILKHD